MMSNFRYLIVIVLLCGFSFIAYGQVLNRDPFDIIVYRNPITSIPGKVGEPIPNRSLVIKLSGILKEEKHSQAIISVGGNSSVFDLYDHILDITIIGIMDNRVLLQRNGKTYILEIGKDLTL